MSPVYRTTSDLTIAEPVESIEDPESPLSLMSTDLEIAEPTEMEYFVEKIAQTEIKIYPNPTTEKITFEFSGGAEMQGRASLRLYTLSGQLLQEQPVHSATTTVSLAGLAKGAYILKVQINGITEDWKIIKQ